MKKFITTAAFILGVTVLSHAASDTATTSSAVDIQTTDCLTRYAKQSETRSYYGAPGEYHLSYNDGQLTVTWYNITGNCCPVEWKVEVEKDGDNLKFTAYDVNGLCDCICPYNLTATYTDIEAGEYTVTFTNIYDENIPGRINIKEGMDITLSAGTTDIADIKSEGSILSVSAEGILHVSSDNDTTVEIYNTSGVMMAALNVGPDSDIDINTLPKGLYIAKTKSGNTRDSLIFAR